jgi:hypothetical protein
MGWRLPHDALRLTVGAGGLADSGARPIISVAGVESGEELCQRPIPAIFGSARRCGGDHLPCLLVLAANQCEGRMRASFGEDLVGPVLIRSGVSFTLASGVDLSFAPFKVASRPINPTAHDRRTRATV